MTTSIRIQLSIGLAVLVIGTLVYVLDRPAEQTLLTSAIDLPSLKVGIFGPIGRVLPTFAHVFAFILFTVVVLGNTRLASILACAGWLVVELAFELGQHPQVATWLSAVLSPDPDSPTIIVYTANYFVSGTFDPWDLVAICLGALTAYVVIKKTQQQEFCHE